MKPTYATATWLFIRLLGVVYLFAFWSLALQVLGLIGHDGILPAADFMARAREWADGTGVGLDRYRLLPTLGWLSTSDGFLRGLSLGGAALAVLLVAGVLPVVILPLLWAAYLSLVVLGGEFFSFQWDALLLEAGLLAVVIAPLGWRHRLRDAPDPPLLARWLLWWLLFRLMFGSGIVKLMSGDPTWSGLTALAVHYETQPLPTPLAWYATQLTRWFHQTSTALVLVIELFVPWLMFLGRRVRVPAAIVLIALQVLIALTGNYAFFNLLTIALCVMLFDDRALGRAASFVIPKSKTSVSSVPLWFVDHVKSWIGGPAGGWKKNLAPAVFAIATLPVSMVMLASQLGFAAPARLGPLVGAIGPLQSVNRYGLFAVMTTIRQEIVVEGSADGLAWRAYEFRHKPGDPARRPSWVAPFQPRLDWQMWFAALGRYDQEPWFRQFCSSLLEGSPSVTALLADDPFDGRPPRFVRATLYRYRLTDWSTGRATSRWWTREPVDRPALVIRRSQYVASGFSRLQPDLWRNGRSGRLGDALALSVEAVAGRR